MPTSRESPNLILLNGGIAQHDADWNWRDVSSPFARIYFVREGEAKIIMADRVLSVAPGFLYMIPPFTMHGYECDGYFSLYYFHIYEKPSAKIRVLEEYDFNFIIQCSALMEALVVRLLQINPERELQRYDPLFYDNTSTLSNSIDKYNSNPYPISVETNGILCQLLAPFLCQATLKSDKIDDRIGNVVRYIRHNIDKSMSTSALSQICFMTTDHLIRIFKKELNCTPVEYINRRKTEKAQLLLTTTNMSIKDIAYSLSFNNASYFNRVFKRITGKSPHEYRQVQDK